MHPDLTGNSIRRTQIRPFESDQTRRAPWSGVGGSTTLTCRVTRIDPPDMAAGERRVPDIASGRRADAVRTSTLRRIPGLDDTVVGIKPPQHARLTREPQDARRVEHGGVQVRRRMRRRKGEDLHVSGDRVHPDDGVEIPRP